MKLSSLFVFIIGVMLLLTSLQGVRAETERDIVGYWAFDLQPGFNFVSFPVLPETPTPRSVNLCSLGAVEITTWDRLLGRHRWARYNPENDRWLGDLYLLDRGVAYWIRLIDSNEPVRFVVTGHPELYRKFSWSRLEGGWNFYAPTFGREQNLADLPPDNSSDLLLTWDSQSSRFLLADVNPDKEWRSNAFNNISPNGAYIVYLHRDGLREGNLPARRDDAGNNDPVAFGKPPRPLVVSNIRGMPVRRADGDVCSGDYNIRVLRENLRIGADGELESLPETVAEYYISAGESAGGFFKLALTIGAENEQLQPRDRIYLVASQNGTETRSNSFEVGDDVWLVQDLSFPEPMSTPGEAPLAVGFTLGNPYPNPFNDRFQIEFNLPETGMVRYTLYDLNGRTVKTTVQPFSAGTHRLNFSGRELSAGIYLLEVADRTDRKITKVAYVR